LADPVPGSYAEIVAWGERATERRRPELQPLRAAVDHAQTLWSQLAALEDDDPQRPGLVRELDTVQTRIQTLRRRHGMFD
jgi:hypothetical protein